MCQKTPTMKSMESENVKHLAVVSAKQMVDLVFKSMLRTNIRIL